ncbi:histidinol-phosphate aminotransferase [Rhizobium leguminosarum]|uniref:Histidinol-phosphate aminotransferase n=1 Tax=Rhizobium leguminosarum TaxID=384 RepID=A0AAE2SXD2_RHILE|nr:MULTISPECIES: histidinol-phosphate transaminase [Rhizobium]MBB4291687.1 histidinol-phosphate aminotransferase [Rhizobium leguminosarum]MBB4298287.1 histidinol-phosphate aminotransferase [Rhizobium leguminosarum]MBB4309425.1 histidinol-phosphate aminotransferase [Rhizobium leguminosarum]MBB4418862.1 histidinol-phosphate aminotransferase [Rhizobium leguminosarum]MBB4433807.1 histidinol-phosphate aminotransferase [Rhizobium esperanzae]
MSRYWSDIVSKLQPYVAGEQPRIPGLVKLNTNENPYGPSPRALEAIGQATDDRLRLYPDPSATELRETIAARHALTADEVFVGNGSDEVLAHVFQALLKHDLPLLYPDVTYSFYPTYSLLYGIEAIEIPVDDRFQIRLADYDRPCGAIIIPNPNAPTGIGLPLADIEALVATHPDAVVVIDEAYVDFGGESAIPLISRYPNLLVIQTLSKSRSFAGLRVGFALGQRELIEALVRVKDSFNSYPLDRLAQVAATAAIQDEAWFETCRKKLIASRDHLVTELEALDFEVLPSQANFIFARHESRSGAALLAALRERDILVRLFAKPRIADFLRISIGTDEECAGLVAALKAILAA